MTFRLDVRWRRRAVRRSACRPGSPCSTWPAAPATSASTCAAPATGRSPSTSASACCAPTAAGRPGSRPTSCACPCPTASVDGVTCGFALRNLVDLGAFFAELGCVVRPGRAHRPARRRHAPATARAAGPRHLFGTVVPRIGGLLSDAAAYRYLPRSVAYLPAPAEMVAMLARRRVRRRHPRPVERRHHPALVPGPADACRHPVPTTRGARPQRHRRGDGFCSSATASASPGRGVAARGPRRDAGVPGVDRATSTAPAARRRPGGHRLGAVRSRAGPAS